MGGAVAAVGYRAYADRFTRHGRSLLPASVPFSVDTPPDGSAVMVELFVDGAWMNITAQDLVYARQPVSITYGQTDENSFAQPGRCTMLINNRNGQFSPRNPTSPLYGKIGRNTQMRVSVQDGFSKVVRFWGEVPAWPSNWDPSGADVWVEVQASGVLRRLNQASTPLTSTLYQAYTDATLLATNPPIEYWPMEDGSTATLLASANGGNPMTIRGTPTLSSSTVFAASKALPVCASAAFAGNVRGYTATGQTQIRFLQAFPISAQASPDKSTIVEIFVSGTAHRIELYYNTGGGLGLRAFDLSGAAIGDTGAIAFGMDGTNVRVSLEFTESGGNVLYHIDTTVPGTFTTTGFNGTLSTGHTVGAVTSIIVAPSQNQTNVAVGHLTVQSTITGLLDQQAQLSGYLNETADNRAYRLTLSTGVTAGAIGFTGDSVAMGPQTPQTILNLLQECVTADGGSLYERWAGLGLGYRMRTALYNRPVDVTLDYAAFNLSVVPVPLDDDRFTKNDITATRVNGSSARATQANQLAGPLSILPPPLGVGPYPDAPSLNIASDATLADQAGWRLWVGTQDRPRYPQIGVNLSHASIVANPALRSQVLNARPGARIQIVNPPVWMGPGPLDLLLVGGSETIDRFEHKLTFTCVPFTPYLVAILGDPVLSVGDTDGSTLVQGLGPTDASMLVATTNPGSPLWTTNAVDFPFDVLVGGEQITVTNITGATSPQTFTITRSVNGVVKSQQPGTDIRLFQPMILAL